MPQLEDNSLKDQMQETLAREMTRGFQYPTEHIFHGVLKALREGGQEFAERWLEEKRAEYDLVQNSPASRLEAWAAPIAARIEKRKQDAAAEATRTEEERRQRAADALPAGMTLAEPNGSVHARK